MSPLRLQATGCPKALGGVARSDMRLQPGEDRSHFSNFPISEKFFHILPGHADVDAGTDFPARSHSRGEPAA
jgi:hypothetical protein